MAWSSSLISRAAVADILGNTAAFDLNSGSWLMALFNNSITPDGDAAAASYAFDAGQWDNANEVADSTEWDAGGEALSSLAVNTAAGGIVRWTSAAVVSGSSATLASYGCLLYQGDLTTPVADQGFCHLYFGGIQSITDGTFTVTPHSDGWASFDLTP